MKEYKVLNPAHVQAEPVKAHLPPAAGSFPAFLALQLL
jgi:hypothetical protein